MQETASKMNVLYLCTGNSCRSQMAEGWTRYFWPKEYSTYSAGIETHGVNPKAIKVMAEAGVDISGHTSKHVDSLNDVTFDYVFTVCGDANEQCPVFGKEVSVIHVGFEDPPKLAAKASSDEEALNCYRRVRDEIRDFVERLPEEIKERS